MTGKDLLETVTLMGFAKTLEHNEEYFFRAANLSLSRICRSFPLFGEITLSPKENEEYDVASLTDDFLGFPAAFLTERTENRGRLRPLILTEGRDFTVRNSAVRFLRDFDVPITLHYVRRAHMLSMDTLDKPLDVHPMAESLLPLLTASYLWLDDRGDLATQYLSLYRAEAEELKRHMYRHGGIHIVTNGWDT